MRKTLILVLAFFTLLSCNQAKQTTKTEEAPLIIPTFSPDSAYNYVNAQVQMGPRVPNSKQHNQCAEYLTSQLKKFGANVIEQNADLKGYDGKVLHSVNIIGVFNPKATIRILLCSHWDCRPWSDHDPDPKNFNKPVSGANDGASGVGVLLEIARQIGIRQPQAGVDIVFFDSEDYGAPANYPEQSEDFWCLGSQYWASNPHIAGYHARFGILLDMVGAPGATFYKEQFSDYYASDIVNKVWEKAQKLGFSQFFIPEESGGITDDHIYVNKIIGIPCIDIIHYSPNLKNGFGDYWHTTNDTMENIDKNTLNAVGTTLLNVIYAEK